MQRNQSLQQSTEKASRIPNSGPRIEDGAATGKYFPTWSHPNAALMELSLILFLLQLLLLLLMLMLVLALVW